MKPDQNMKPDHHDDRMIQRCLDDELSPEDTRRLLDRLDQISDGWKILACGFLTERSFARSLAGERQSERVAISRLADDGARAPHRILSSPSRSDEESVIRPEEAFVQTALGNRASSSRTLMVYWWSHPVTSMVLCAAVAFFAGLLIPDLNLRGSRSDRDELASNARPADTAGSEAAGHDSIEVGPRDSRGGRNGYYVVFDPDGTSPGSGMTIPLTKSREELMRSLRDSQRLSQQMQQRFSQWSDQGAGEGFKAVLVPLNETHNALIFVNDQSFGQPAQ